VRGVVEDPRCSVLSIPANYATPTLPGERIPCPKLRPTTMAIALPCYAPKLYAFMHIRGVSPSETRETYEKASFVGFVEMPDHSRNAPDLLSSALLFCREFNALV